MRHGGENMKNAMLALLVLIGMSAIVVYAGPNELKDEGVGTYTDPSVANQISNFTINRQMVSCGVGTISGGPFFSGPFAMLMYAKDISLYHANHLTKVIRATGRMRSITHIGGAQAEDTEHDFIAIALDNGSTGDHFEVHFRTCLWNGPAPGPGACPPSPMCTPSSEVPDGCRFGGTLVTDSSGMTQMGEITVGP
jgi:hypothetical protein